MMSWQRARAGARPRSRGENALFVADKLSEAGSSPLTRGKRAHWEVRRSAEGLIPAHAGKTAASASRRRPPRAHPRSRGENGGDLADGEGVAWLIPAHAGKTCGSSGANADARAHPRSRGENFEAPQGPPWYGGSSPLTRGKRVHAVRPQQRRRLIPAHAGKTR